MATKTTADRFPSEPLQNLLPVVPATWGACVMRPFFVPCRCKRPLGTAEDEWKFPRTPDRHEVCSKKAWEGKVVPGTAAFWRSLMQDEHNTMALQLTDLPLASTQVRAWRLRLHQWDPKAEDWEEVVEVGSNCHSSDAIVNRGLNARAMHIISYFRLQVPTRVHRQADDTAGGQALLDLLQVPSLAGIAPVGLSEQACVLPIRDGYMDGKIGGDSGQEARSGPSE